MQQPTPLLLIILFSLSANLLSAQNDYFFPEGSQFDADIPTLTWIAVWLFFIMLAQCSQSATIAKMINGGG